MHVEGKTKSITAGPDEGTVFLRTKNELTGGDAAKRAHIEGIAAHKTSQAANAFGYLEQVGIPTAFIKQHDETSLICDACEMIPLELVSRRFAWGSFLKREPSFATKDGKPYKFDEIKTEIFHKNAVVVPPTVDVAQQMEESLAREKFLKDGVWAPGIYTDPYVRCGEKTWDLFPAKEVLADQKAPLLSIEAELSPEELEQLRNEIMIPCFSALEKAWAKVETTFGPVALADMKIEVGRRVSDGKIVLADVVDNDSWRIWPGADPTKQLDKQNFRDGHSLSQVADNYALVAELTKQFTH
jgi:phosphoribosylaminoimidazole-succinocarboxamide synthase